MSFLKRNKGFTLIEIAIVLAIMGVIITAIGQATTIVKEKNMGRIGGTQLKEMLGAGSSYMSANVDALVQGTAITGVANPLAPTFNELKAMGYINAAVPAVNEFGSNWNFSLSRQPVGCVAPACDILVTVNPTAAVLYEGKINYGVLYNIVSEVGNDGGYSEDTDSGNIHGPNNSWTIANPLGNVTGVVMARAGFGSQGFAQFIRNGDTRNVSVNGNLAVNGATGVTTTDVTATGDVTAAGNIGTAGNLSVAGNTSTTGTTTATGGITVAGTGVTTNTIAATVSSLGNATATKISTGQLTSTTSNTGTTTATTLAATTINAAGGVTAGGKLTGQYVVPTTIATENAACGAGIVNGTLAATSAGGSVSCQSGVWVASSTKPCVHGSWISSTPGAHLITIPSECTKITAVDLIGGGGSGGNGYYAVAYSAGHGGNGGGAGQRRQNVIASVVHTGSITISIGASNQATTLSANSAVFLSAAAGGVGAGAAGGASGANGSSCSNGAAGHNGLSFAGGGVGGAGGYGGSGSQCGRGDYWSGSGGGGGGGGGAHNGTIFGCGGGGGGGGGNTSFPPGEGESGGGKGGGVKAGCAGSPQAGSAGLDGVLNGANGVGGAGGAGYASINW